MCGVRRTTAVYLSGLLQYLSGVLQYLSGLCRGIVVGVSGRVEEVSVLFVLSVDRWVLKMDGHQCRINVAFTIAIVLSFHRCLRTLFHV